MHVPRICYLYNAVVMCDTLSSPSNGSVFQTGTTFGETANYTCNPGFKLMGESTRICQDTGLWSGIAPTCQRKFQHPYDSETLLHSGCLSGQVIYNFGAMFRGRCSPLHSILQSHITKCSCMACKFLLTVRHKLLFIKY